MCVFIFWLGVIGKGTYRGNSFLSLVFFQPSRMAESFDNHTCKHNTKSLGRCSSFWHHVEGHGWAVPPWGQGLWHQAGAVRQWALGSWLHSNCCSCLSSCFSNPFYFRRMLEWPHHGEQEEEPSELVIKCEMLMLWACLLPEKNSATLLSSSSSHTQGSRQSFMILLSYIFLF